MAGKKKHKFSKARFHRFRQFCRKTTLHGWSYLAEDAHIGASWQRAFWLVVILVVYSFAGAFVFTNTKQYFDAAIMTSFTTKTSALADVYFPSITICNINQMEVRKSLWRMHLL